MGKLTAAKVKAIKKPGRYGDGNTLLLNVAPGGSKSWIQRITIAGKCHDIGLGGWPIVSLEKARRRAFENRVAVSEGRDPLAEKRRAKTPTFREAAERTYEGLKPRWRSTKGTKNWIQQLERHAFSRLGDLPVDTIGREDVLAVLTPIWTCKPETARRVRRNIRATLSWCQASGYVETNVAGEAIDGALPSMPAVKENYRSLPYQEVPEAVVIVWASRASLAAKACLEFVVLTACRSGEARNAEWREIDLEAREWRIPSQRMKGGKEHRQPLSNAAVAVLEKAREIDDGSGLIFPSPVRKGKPLSDMSLTKLLRDTGIAERAVVHGFRSSFRTWASECTNADHAVMELCLAHAVGSSVERSYARSDLYQKRARLLAQWGAFVRGGARGKVVQLHG